MKYLFSLLAVLAFNVTYAQTFKWDSKSPETMPQEVQPNMQQRAAYDKAYNERQNGLAGIYNPTMQGQRTSYGETYANRQMTASHPVLPLGTIVTVQNVDNGRTAQVRINDSGQECADCLITLSDAAAKSLGINYRGRVVVERTGFSNWNPAAPSANQQTAAPQAYGNNQTYQQPAVTQPVVINRNPQWEARGGATYPQQQQPTTQAPATYGSPQPAATTTRSPLAYGTPQQQQQAPATTYRQPATYGSAPQPANNNYAVLNVPATPSVTSREVQPADVNRQPTTYSRYPTQATTYQQAPRPYGTTTYQQQVPVQQAPAQQQAPVQQQAAPPASTVARYQDNRTVPAPATYRTPATSAPQPYIPPTQQARSVAVPTTAAPASAPAPSSGFGVQLGAYSNEMYAQARVDQLKAMGMSNIFYKSVQKPDGQMINRVYAGTFGSIAEAQNAARLIQGNHQIAGIVTRF